MILLQRIFLFLLLALFVVIVPWYVALVALLLALILTGWYELVCISVLIDALMGAGMTATFVPIATLVVGGVALLRAIVQPYLFASSIDNTL
jgi:hypothetical protein